MSFLGTKAGFYSDLSMVLEICTTIAFTTGVLYARKHKGIFHHRIMLSALALDIGFLVSYMVKSLIEGRTEFPKLTFPIAYKYVYLPIVISHSIISIIVLALAVFVVYIGFKWSIRKETITMPLEKRKRHGRFGKITVITWYGSFASGVAVYLLLYVLY